MEAIINDDAGGYDVDGTYHQVDEAVIIVDGSHHQRRNSSIVMLMEGFINESICGPLLDSVGLNDTAALLAGAYLFLIGGEKTLWRIARCGPWTKLGTSDPP